MNEESQVVATEDTPVVAPATAPELNISDLQNLRAIINTAVRRGAFGAEEMTSVGAVYDRLNAFLELIAPAATADEVAAETEA